MSDRTRELECVISDLKQQARDAERARDELLAALKRIADGQEMSGTYTFGDVVLRYQEIARAAIASATGEQQP